MPQNVLESNESKTEAERGDSDMNTKEIATEYRLTHWAGIMRERSERGLIIRDYCKQSGFHENVYYYCQRKLKEAGAEKIKSSGISGRYLLSLRLRKL